MLFRLHPVVKDTRLFVQNRSRSPLRVADHGLHHSEYCLPSGRAPRNEHRVEEDIRCGQ